MDLETDRQTDRQTDRDWDREYVTRRHGERERVRILFQSIQ